MEMQGEKEPQAAAPTRPSSSLVSRGGGGGAGMRRRKRLGTDSDLLLREKNNTVWLPLPTPYRSLATFGSLVQVTQVISLRFSTEEVKHKNALEAVVLRAMLHKHMSLSDIQSHNSSEPTSVCDTTSPPHQVARKRHREITPEPRRHTEEEGQADEPRRRRPRHPPSHESSEQHSPPTSHRVVSVSGITPLPDSIRTTPAAAAASSDVRMSVRVTLLLACVTEGITVGVLEAWAYDQVARVRLPHLSGPSSPLKLKGEEEEEDRSDHPNQNDTMTHPHSNNNNTTTTKTPSSLCVLARVGEGEVAQPGQAVLVCSDAASLWCTGIRAPRTARGTFSLVTDGDDDGFAEIVFEPAPVVAESGEEEKAVKATRDRAGALSHSDFGRHRGEGKKKEEEK